MHPTISVNNVNTSIKLFFYEELENIRELPLSFDRSLSMPNYTRQSKVGSIDKWVTVLFQNKTLANVSEQVIEFICCSRQDVDQVKLAEVIDLLQEVLFPQDKKCVFPLYNIVDEGIVGHLFLNTFYGQTGFGIAKDKTNICSITVGFKWIPII